MGKKYFWKTVIMLAACAVMVLTACSAKKEAEVPDETEAAAGYVSETETEELTEESEEPAEEEPDYEEETDPEPEETEEQNPYAGYSNGELAVYAYDRFNGSDSTLFGYRARDYGYDPDDFPEIFDLRENGVVTLVKCQTPWGSCWAFGTIAACETSILSRLGKTYEETGLDLSEKHLAYFARSFINDGSEQDSEGIHLSEGAVPYAGNLIYSSTSLLSSGIGVVDEKVCPYCAADGTRDPLGDWSVPDDIKFLQSYELEETRVLPETVIADEDRNYMGLDQNAVYVIKEQLLEGKGVAASYLPNDDYFNFETYGQYYPTVTGSTHSVCIVGWDDTFDRELFVEAPPGDGAWIVKNSWDTDWGDEGYFYLSYYDGTVKQFTSFEFNVDDTENDYYFVDQYDYLQSAYSKCWFTDEPTGCANVFRAEEDETLRCISVETVLPGTYVSYVVYLLDDDSDSPEAGQIIASGETQFDFPGYHRMGVDTEGVTIPKDALYSVIVYQAADQDEKTVYAVSCDSGDNKHSYDETVEEYGDPGIDEWSVGIVNGGESWLYISEAERWIDWADVLEVLGEFNPNRDYDNFPIKGYADPVK